MSAQKENQTSITHKTSNEERGRQQTTLARRGMSFSLVPSLWTDSFDLINPFSLMKRMQEELNRAFSATGVRSTSAQRGDSSGALWIPAVEVAYRDGNFVVSAELPGLTDEDVTVEIDDQAVVIQGERQVEYEENEGGISRTERRYGQFYRAIPLPEGANPDQARAEFKDGMLQISVPVSESQSNRRQISIQGAGSAQSSTSSPSSPPASQQAGGPSAKTESQSVKGETPAQKAA
jgi:HSP20 family protein